MSEQLSKLMNVSAQHYNFNIFSKQSCGQPFSLAIIVMLEVSANVQCLSLKYFM